MHIHDGYAFLDNAKFVTESVDMDFSKDNIQRNPMVLLHKVQDKSCCAIKHRMISTPSISGQSSRTLKDPTLETSLAKTVPH